MATSKQTAKNLALRRGFLLTFRYKEDYCYPEQGRHKPALLLDKT